MTQDPEAVGQAELERRYHRMLAWFPAEHRRAHGEEIVGVLLAAAAPGQHRVGLRDRLDLILGALRIRLRPGAALSDRDGWRDSLAMFSVAAPVLLLVATCLSLLAGYRWTVMPGLEGSAFSLAMTGEALVVVLVLAGQRLPAMLVAGGQVLVTTGLVIHWLAAQGWSGNFVVTVSGLAAPSVAEVVALLASPGPRRGRRLLRPRHWACLAVTSVPTAVVLPAFFPFRPAAFIFLTRSASWYPNVLVIAAAALLAILAGSWLSSALGKRLVVLFAVLGYPLALDSLAVHGAVTLSQQDAIAAVVSAALLAGGVVFAVRRSGQHRPAGGDPPVAASQ